MKLNMYGTNKKCINTGSIAVSTQLHMRLFGNTFCWLLRLFLQVVRFTFFLQEVLINLFSNSIHSLPFHRQVISFSYAGSYE